MTAFFNWFTLLYTMVAAISSLLSRDWRRSLILLAIQYLGVFWLVHANWPIVTSSTKLITGWMACATLGMTQISIGTTTEEIEKSWLEGRLFQSFIAGIIMVISFSLALYTSNWLGFSLPVAWGGLFLIGMGLLQLGVTSQPLRVIIGLLTTLAGFEIIYAAVEGSILVAALLAIVNLGLALTGAYLLNASHQEVEE